MEKILFNINNLVLLLTLLFNFGLGFYILFKNSRNEVNRTFAAVLFSLAVWSLSFCVLNYVKDPAWILLWRRITPIGSALAAGYLLYFSLIFPPQKQGPGWPVKALIIGPAYLFSVCSVFTPYMIKAVQLVNVHSFIAVRPVFGWLYYFYALFMVLYLIGCTVNLTRKFRKSEGQEKLQLFYILLGLFISVLFGLALSLALPLFGHSRLFSWGPPFTVFFTGFVAYAIVRYRLLNIEDFFTVGLVFLSSVATTVGTVFALLNGLTGLLLPMYTAIANLALGLFVLLHNPKSKTNISFAGITFSVVAWTTSIFLYWQTNDPAAALWFSKLAFISTTFIPAFFAFFSLVYPYEAKIISLTQASIIFVPAAILIVLILLNTIVTRVVSGAAGFELMTGQYYWLFAVYFIGYMGWAFFSLLRRYLRVSGSAKTQIAYVFLGSFLGSIFPVITNLILPLFGNTAFTGIGPLFTILFVAVIAYSIIKYRLMSIEVVIQRSSVYAFTTLLIMAFYALAVIVSETYLRNLIGYSSVLITAVAAMIIAVAYQPLIVGFQNLTDRLFFRGRYDYQKTLREISQKIASVIKLEELTRLIVSSFVDTMKVAEISFLLTEKEGEHFRSISLPVSRYKKIEIDRSSPIVTQLEQSRDILVHDEIDDRLSKAGSQASGKLIEVREAMERLGIPVWVPIISKDKLIGIIALGNKLSGDIFSTEDLALLTTLANQTAVALDNARLYDEVLTMKNYSDDILQSMTNGVLTTDIRGRIVTYNYMAEKITGRKFDDVLGKECEEIWGKRSTITLTFENTIKDRGYLNYETGIASPERGLVPVSISSTLLRDSQEKKMGVLISIQDLTEMKELEDKIRRADKLTALATMASGMAHEIKNPLSSMKVFSQLLPQKYNDPEFRQKLEEILPREIDRIDRIVESLLGFARSTAPTFETVSLEAILEEDLKYFDNQAKNAGVVIKKSFEKLPDLEVDRSQISQAFSNLMLNAIQAMPEGGELGVKTLPGKMVENLLQTVKVQISDSGHGIPEEMIKKLFDPFFTTKYGGTGLGLTITHSIIDGHKGFIDVESHVGKGTIFTVTLPLKQGLL